MDDIKRTLQSSYAQIADRFYKANHAKILTSHFEHFLYFVKKDGLILDVGCGTGRDTAVFTSQSYVAIGLDLTLEMLEKGKNNGVEANLVQADLENLPIRRGVDGIWASASLLHIPVHKIPHVLNQFYNLLNQKGVFYCTIKRGDGAEWTKISYSKQVRRFFNYWQPEAWDSALSQAGFTIRHAWTDSTRTDEWLIRICQKE